MIQVRLGGPTGIKLVLKSPTEAIIGTLQVESDVASDIERVDQVSVDWIKSDRLDHTEHTVEAIRDDLDIECELLHNKVRIDVQFNPIGHSVETPLGVK